jgi:hypothetical protein
MNTALRLIYVAAAVGAVAVAREAEAGRIWPAWSISGAYAVDVPPGFASMAGSWNFPLGDGTVSINNLAYDAKGQLAGGALANNSAGPTLLAFRGTYSVDDAGVQTVNLAEDSTVPGFSFTGVMRADGVYVDGTYVRREGFAGIPGEVAAPGAALTIQRAAVDDVQRTFVLRMATRMDTKGRIRGASEDGAETRALIELYGKRFVDGHFVPITLEDGRIRGKVKTDAAGFTSGLVTIVGRKWKLTLTGPIDAAGFHASCDFTGAGFVLKGVPVTLAVQPGPTPPPGPPPPPPKNLLNGATATIVNGAVTISHTGVPSKFFGATAGLTIQFPATDGQSVSGGAHAIVHADPSTASTPAPDARRCIVTVGSKTYATAIAPADVRFEISKYDPRQGGVVELLATGAVVAQGGSKKTVNVLVQAVVQ